jgi:hypothetical protein
MLRDIQAWLGATALAPYVRDVVSVKALLESAHILANALILFSIGMIAMRLMGLSGRSHSVASMIKRFTPWVWGALVVVAVTGLVLLTGAGRRGLDNPMFQVKLATMAGAILATAALQLSLSADISFWELTPARRAAAKLIAPLCFLLWLATVFAGRWLAYSSTFFPPAY